MDNIGYHRHRTNMVTTTSNSENNSPDYLGNFAALLNKGFGINRDTAELMLLQIIGGISGPAWKIQSPSGFICSAAFDLALFTDGSAMVNAAQAALLGGIADELEQAAELQQAQGKKQSRAHYEHLVQELPELIKAANNEEATLCQKVIPQLAKSFIQGPPVSSSNSSGVKALVGRAQEAAAAVTQCGEDILPIKLACAPGIIRDGERWADLSNAAADSFDGHFLQLGTAESLLAESDALKPGQLNDITAMLHRCRVPRLGGFAKSGTEPTACMQITGAPITFAHLAQQKAVKNSGLLNGMIFADADCDDSHAPFDLAAFKSASMQEWWRDVLSFRLNSRLCNVRDRMTLDDDAIKAYFAFRAWCIDFKMKQPEEYGPFYEHWPELFLQIAMGLAALEHAVEAKVLPVRFLEHAAAMLKAHAPRQGAILERMMGVTAAKRRAEQDAVDALVNRLQSKGPLIPTSRNKATLRKNRGNIQACPEPY